MLRNWIVIFLWDDEPECRKNDAPLWLFSLFFIFYSDCKASISYQHHHPSSSLHPPSLPTPPIKTAGWSNARLHPRAAHRRGFRAANRAICVSYPLHERQRKDRDAHRRPVHSIRASESREAAAYPRYSPVTSLPHPLPPSAVGETARAQPLRQTTRRKHGLHPGGTFRIKRASSKQLVWRWTEIQDSWKVTKSTIYNNDNDNNHNINNNDKL